MRRCDACGGQIPAGASGCPRCLLSLGLSPAGEEALVSGQAFGEFEVVAPLGRGGMGAVYRARQPRLDREVALKVIPLAGAQSPELAERFRREARALAGLNHPHVVTLHDFGEIEGQAYLVMELVDGTDLEGRLQDGPLEARRALEVAIDVCEALVHAHRRGVVHRDVKPGNVLIDGAGEVKVADFGLAKLTEPGGTLTDPLQSMGTPFYAAPEQRARGAEVDHRADIYAVGVLLYQMLTGGLPTGAYPRPSRVASVGRRVDQVVERALQPAPDRRFQQAEQLRDALRDCLLQRPVPLLPALAAAAALIFALVYAIRQDRSTAGAPARQAADPDGPITPPRDVTPLGDRYYKVFYRHMSWPEAERYCRRMGGRLAIADSPRIAHLLARLSRSHVWIGASDAEQEGVWRWVDGSPVRYNNWAPKEPNNLRTRDGEREHYLVITKYGRWNDLAADDPMVKGFVCEWHRTKHPGPLRFATPAQLQAALRRANRDYQGKGRIVVRDGEIVEVDLAHARVHDIAPLRGLPVRRLDISGTLVSNLAPLEGMPLERLAVGRSRVSDLAPLSGLRLEALKLNGIPVADLTPLRGMPLVYLDISHSRVRDLGALRGMPLATLHMNRTRVTELSALRGLPLRQLGLLDTPVRDLSPLADCRQLREVHLPLDAPGLSALERLPRLRLINNRPAAAFWRERER